ncbi:hypothetical protein [Saccharopolyspora sp. NPDC049426]
MLTVWLLLGLTALIALSVAIDLVLWARHLPEARGAPHSHDPG